MGLFLVSYLAAPLVLLAASAGAGLLVRRLARGAVAPVLVLPAGFVTLLAVGTFLTGFSWSFTAPLNWVAIVLLASAASRGAATTSVRCWASAPRGCGPASRRSARSSPCSPPP